MHTETLGYKSTIKMLELWHGKGYVKHNKTQKLKILLLLSLLTNTKNCCLMKEG
jgi:hypothetical protein